MVIEERIIKECPCCGSDAVLESYEARKGWEANVHCNNCLLQMISITYDTKEAEEKNS